MSFLASLINALFRDGGFSAYLLANCLATSGYAVSCHKDAEKQIPLPSDPIARHDNTFFAIANYVLDHFAELAQPDNVLGAWLDENSVLWLDISTIVPSFDRAIEFARKHDQVAIYSHASKSVIYLDEVTKR